jgi:hypothetical protein
MARTLKEFRHDLREELADNPNSPVLFTNEDQLNRWTLNGVRKASEIRPLYATTTFTPQINVVRYAAPAGMIRLDRVVWLPTPPWNERVYGAVYEPHRDQIRIIDQGWSIELPAGEVLTIEYVMYHTEPTRDTVSTLPDQYEDAVLYYATESGLRWLARRLAAGNEGVLSFTRGRYSEKGGDTVTGLDKLAKQANGQAREILGADDPALILSKGKIIRHQVPASPGSPRATA